MIWNIYSKGGRPQGYLTYRPLSFAALARSGGCNVCRQDRQSNDLDQFVSDLLPSSLVKRLCFSEGRSPLHRSLHFPGLALFLCRIRTSFSHDLRTTSLSHYATKMGSPGGCRFISADGIFCLHLPWPAIRSDGRNSGPYPLPITHSHRSPRSGVSGRKSDAGPLVRAHSGRHWCCHRCYCQCQHTSSILPRPHVRGSGPPLDNLQHPDRETLFELDSPNRVQSCSIYDRSADHCSFSCFT